MLLSPCANCRLFCSASAHAARGNNPICVEYEPEPGVDLQHSITARLRGTKPDKYLKMRQILVYVGYFHLPHFQRDSLAAPIHLRSPGGGVFGEGQNLENRLRARYFVSRHPSPASQHQLGHGRRQKYAISRRSDAFALRVCPGGAGRDDIWMLLKFGESRLLWLKCLSPRRVSLFGGKPVERGQAEV